MGHADHYRRHDPDRRFLQSRLWRERLRPAALRREPLCCHCRALGRVTAAEEIDHIIRPRGDKRLQRDPANLQALCAEHHQQKSLWERRDDGQPLLLGAGDDGWPIEAPGGTVPRESGSIEQPAAQRNDHKRPQLRFDPQLNP